MTISAGRKLNIWWKLAFVSGIITIVTFPVWFIETFGKIFLTFSEDLSFFYNHYSGILFVWIIAVPIAYFSIFCIWHWKVRYAGNHHLAWAVFFVFSFWGTNVTYISGSTYIAVLYFFMHIIPDIRSKGLYADHPEVKVVPPASSFPGTYKFAKSVCLAAGWGLILVGLFWAVVTCAAYFTVWDTFAETIPDLEGELITKKVASALFLAVDTGKVSVVSSLVCALFTVFGAVLIQISNMISLRLFEAEQSKNNLLEEADSARVTFKSDGQVTDK